MNIKKFLEYQEVDKELQKFNKSLNYSQEAKAVQISKQQVQEAKDSLIKLDRLASELFVNFGKYIDLLESNQIKTKEFKKVIEEINDIKEIDYVQKKLDELISDCNYLNKEINKVKDKIHMIKLRTNESMKLGKVSSEKYKKAKASFDKLKDEMNPEAQKVLDRLSELEKQINEPEIIKRYKKLKANNTMPAIVKCENASCMGCGMNIASNLQTKMETTDKLVECPNCGRLMYKE